MKKTILILFLISNVAVFSQPERYRRPDFKPRTVNNFIFTQTIVIPSDSIHDIYFLFKIPYKNIVFLKNGNSYNASFRLNIEVSDSNNKFVKREIKDWKTEAVTFEQTRSSDLFAEGFIKLNLPPGSYSLYPIFSDQSSSDERKMEPVEIKISPEEPVEPLIVDSEKINCNGSALYRLTNLSNGIPFDFGNHNILIPFSDTSVKQITVSIISSEDTLLNITISESFISPVNFLECAGKVFVGEGNNPVLRNFILKDIDGKLKEGEIEIIVDNDIKFTREVIWYNKPQSLKNPGLAIEALKFIEKEEVIDSLLDLPEEDYYKGLVSYWKQKDPTPSTEFNELMTEYYNRVDYARMNFSSITGKNGIDTDRGKIYIQLGKPDDIERSSNAGGKIVETWIYEKRQLKFVFVDKNGVGEFSLESS